MKLIKWMDHSDKTRHLHVIIPEEELAQAHSRMDSMDRYCISEWGRDGSSAEEKFMALQLIARKLEEDGVVIIQ